MDLEIILNGVHYKLVKDEEYIACTKCSLQNICVRNGICLVFDIGDDEYFQRVEE